MRRGANPIDESRGLPPHPSYSPVLIGQQIFCPLFTRLNANSLNIKFPPIPDPFNGYDPKKIKRIDV